MTVSTVHFFLFIIRIKDEIKFLFKKKEKLNHDRYIFHVKAAQVFI